MVVGGSEHYTFALCIIYTWHIVLRELPSLIVDFKHYGFLQDVAHKLFDRIVWTLFDNLSWLGIFRQKYRRYSLGSLHCCRFRKAADKDLE